MGLGACVVVGTLVIGGVWKAHSQDWLCHGVPEQTKKDRAGPENSTEGNEESGWRCRRRPPQKAAATKADWVNWCESGREAGLNRLRKKSGGF
jgi:hypothetical protein